MLKVFPKTMLKSLLSSIVISSSSPSSIISPSSPFLSSIKRRQNFSNKNLNILQQTKPNTNKIMTKYYETGTNLLDLPATEVREWINSFDTVLSDCDGVLWSYSQPIPGSSCVINKFKEELKKKVYFVTNNSTKTRQEFLEKAHQLDFHVNEDEILSTAYATAMYLKNRNFNKKAYIIGSNGIAKELDAIGIDHTDIGPDVLQGNFSQLINNKFHSEKNIGAVIIGFDEHFSFPKMTKAASYLNKSDCLFIATNTDECFPMENYVIPGTGSFVRCIETCAERKATVIGKPNTYMCENLLKNKLIIPERTLMIGDRCNTDILLGKNCGFQTLLVGTGIHNLCDVKKWKEYGSDEEKRLIPDTYLPKLGDLLQYLK